MLMYSCVLTQLRPCGFGDANVFESHVYVLRWWNGACEFLQIFALLLVA